MDNEPAPESTPEFDMLGDLLDGKDIDAEEYQHIEEKPEEEPTAEPKADEEPKGEGEQPPAVEEQPTKADPTKEQIKEALRELSMEQQQGQVSREALRTKVRNELYKGNVKNALPPILDDEDKPINGPADIAGKLRNPITNETFTYEEAKDWWDTATRERAKKMDELEQDVDAIAETHQNLNEGEQVVMRQYGDLLRALPQVADEIFQAYSQTLVKDAETGIVTKAPISVVKFYEMALRPYLAISNQFRAEAEAKAKAEKAQSDKQSQAGRTDLGTTGLTDPDENKDDLDKAFDDYFNK